MFPTEPGHELDILTAGTLPILQCPCSVVGWCSPGSVLYVGRQQWRMASV